MKFENCVLTTAGRDLIAQASSANKVVFEKTLASVKAYSVDALMNIDESSLSDAEGTIKTTSATGNVARIVGELTNGETAKTVKTIGITGRLSTQDKAVVVAVQSDTTAEIYIPSINELSTSIQVAFNLAFSDGEAVEVNSAANVSIGDFERLAERVVSTHADGDAEKGESQTILGDKSFENTVYSDSFQSRTRSTSSGSGMVGSQVYPIGWGFFDNFTANNIYGSKFVSSEEPTNNYLEMTTGNSSSGYYTYLLAEAHGVVYLGTKENPFTKLHVETANTEVLNVSDSATVSNELKVNGTASVGGLSIDALDDDLLGKVAAYTSKSTPAVGQIGLVAVDGGSVVILGMPVGSKFTTVYPVTMTSDENGGVTLSKGSTAYSGTWSSLVVLNVPANTTAYFLAIRTA